MIPTPHRSRQPARLPWSRERLVHEHAIALGHVLAESSKASYSSALNSYLNFCRIHEFPVEPTEDTLSFYVTYMSHHIEPRSVDSYLSGICSELENFFPDVRRTRKAQLVSRMLKGCMRLCSNPIRRKRALTRDDLNLVQSSLPPDPSFDDKLFLTLLLTGFNGLMRLGELVWPDKVSL